MLVLLLSLLNLLAHLVLACAERAGTETPQVEQKGHMLHQDIGKELVSLPLMAS